MDTKLVKKADEIYGYYHDMKLNEKKSKIIKEEIEKVCKQRRIDKEEIDGYIVRKDSRDIYTWKPGIYKILKKNKKLNQCLKHGNEMKERFDLKPYVVPKTEDDLYLKAGKIQRSSEQLDDEKKELEKFITDLTSNDLRILIQKFAQQKKMFEILNQKYEADKARLLDMMLRADVDKVVDFKIYLKEDKYDFDKMPSAMKERVMIATNGIESIDLFKLIKTDGNKLDTLKTLEIVPDDLDNTIELKKRFGKKKLGFLVKRLGENFWYEEGYRVEEDIHSRFPINSTEVDKLLQKEEIPEREVMRQKRIDTTREPKEFYEIISVENNEERKRGLALTKA